MKTKKKRRLQIGRNAKLPEAAAQIVGPKATGGLPQFPCPNCGSAVVQILDFAVLIDRPVEYAKNFRTKVRRDFTIEFEIYCPDCQYHGDTEITNIGFRCDAPMSPD